MSNRILGPGGLGPEIYGPDMYRACREVDVHGRLAPPRLPCYRSRHMADLHIRGARPSDRDAIAAVTLAAYQQYAAMIPDFWEAYRQNILATLAAVQPAEDRRRTGRHHRRDGLTLSNGNRVPQRGRCVED